MEKKININVFSAKDGSPRIKKDCHLLKNFRYKGEDFFLTKDNIYYDVSIKTSDSYISIWNRKIVSDDGTMLIDSEICTLFRTGFDKNKITSEKINEFIKNPLPKKLKKVNKIKKK